MATCNFQCSKVDYQRTFTSVQLNFQNFYGFSESSRSQCSQLCPQVFNSTFNEGQYKTFFGDETFYGCFYGTLNGVADWWIYTLIDRNGDGINEAFVSGKCPSNCMSTSDKARFKQKALLPAQIEGCDSTFQVKAVSTPTITISSSSSPSTTLTDVNSGNISPKTETNIGVIVGSVVGAVIALLLSIFIAVFIIRRRGLALKHDKAIHVSPSTTKSEIEIEIPPSDTPTVFIQGDVEEKDMVYIKGDIDQVSK
ncbi:hypothetical protein HK098_004041 [Nowakowskiella sp. JEL0407]|nr:hypothetical protein HK098_004041 [Nowakowskiella sp. JEL0407]